MPQYGTQYDYNPEYMQPQMEIPYQAVAQV
jgi:hypothetical protein